MSEFISAAALLMAAAAVIVGSAALGLALRAQGRTGDGQAGEASPGTAPGEASPGAAPGGEEPDIAAEREQRRIEEGMANILSYGMEELIGRRGGRT
ncbi:MAG TPA: hypothetical protein IAB77_06140 [Candidatus Scatomorpha intestinavium]|uniref:Uncharacterized protein n=1 Tax=Candidatus Scatomorpha intestinavium TaxID=2840922 RepID=A0A9D0ZEL2_9FIRM|nr:hypothetical protein [Candidatus Scatomorpha intestinavium]